MFQSKISVLICLFLASFSLIISANNLDVHGLEFRDDEIFYFNSTSEMVRTSDYLSPRYFGEDRFQKPILYYWLVLLSYKIFGIGWFGARFVASIFASLTVVLTWIIAKDFFDKKVATMSAVVLMTIPLFLRHAKNVVPDMPLNFFVVLAMFYAIKFMRNASDNSLMCKDGFVADDKYNVLLGCMFFLSCALGFMIKGLAAIVIPFVVLVLFLMLRKHLKLLVKIGIFRGLCLMSLVIAPWFIYMMLKYGGVYASHVLDVETRSRILGAEFGNGLFSWIKMFSSHLLFYFKNILSYFAPWSVFFFLSFPYFIFKKGENLRSRDGILILTLWIVVSLLIFSAMYFVINHYMLVISVPFSILVAYFLTQDFGNNIEGKILGVVVRVISIVVFTTGTAVFSLLILMSSQVEVRMLVPISVFYVLGMLMMLGYKRCIYRNVALCSLLLLFALNTNLIAGAGLTSHSTLQRLANVINNDNRNNYIVSVGSHDIHEKELQVYFDKRVDKSGASFEQGNINNIKKLFSGEEGFYLLILESDFKRYVEALYGGQIDIIAEDQIVRRRTDLDIGFLKAIFSFDRNNVKRYLMEKVFLLRRDKHV